MCFSVRRAFGCAHFLFLEDTYEMYILGVIIGAVIAGSIVGAVPAICGAVKHKIGLAIGGYFACLVAHFILGLILSVPTCAVFLFFIFKKPKAVETVAESAEATETQE